MKIATKNSTEAGKKIAESLLDFPAGTAYAALSIAGTLLTERLAKEFSADRPEQACTFSQGS
jgi:hypothetical protein